VSSTSQVDNELAALKAELGTSSGADSTAALPSADPAGTGTATGAGGEGA
jgi:hypothetical protein